jgi:hypothetical protein
MFSLLGAPWANEGAEFITILNLEEKFPCHNPVEEARSITARKPPMTQPDFAPLRNCFDYHGKP